MSLAAPASRFDRERLERIPDGLVTALAVVLPWSTTGTAILAVAWLISLLPVRDFGALGRAVRTPAGGLPIALFALAVIGTLWADVSWSERLHGINAFLRLLAVPILIAQFTRSPRAHWIVNGLLASITLLLVVSSLHVVWPLMPPFTGQPAGLPVVDYIVQSALFTLAIFLFLEMAAQAWHEHRFVAGVAMVLLCCCFLANILTVATGRTTLLVLPVLLVLFSLRQASLKSALAIGLIGIVLAGVAWTASPYLRGRVNGVFDEIRRYEAKNEFTSAGYRLEFWRNAIEMVKAAPVLGHGTGSIRDSYRRAIESGRSTLTEPTPNPHNQTLGVAIQLGLVGATLLVAMWLAHLLLFARGTSLTAWAGLVVVTQHVIGALFNSHLFDFTMGWLYVLVVGVMGGAAMRSRASAPPREIAQQPGDQRGAAGERGDAAPS